MNAEGAVAAAVNIPGTGRVGDGGLWGVASSPDSSGCIP